MRVLSVNLFMNVCVVVVLFCCFANLQLPLVICFSSHRLPLHENHNLPGNLSCNATLLIKMMSKIMYLRHGHHVTTSIIFTL